VIDQNEKTTSSKLRVFIPILKPTTSSPVSNPHLILHRDRDTPSNSPLILHRVRETPSKIPTFL